jgi:predicted nucleic acid-binding protein
MIVVDASVAVKWFLPEQNADSAAALFDADDSELIAPDLLVVEVCSTLVRGANMVKSNRTDALNKLHKFQSMLEAGDVNVVRSAPDQLHRAACLAIDLGHPLKDCLYLVLAMERNCDLVTADARFAGKARGMWDKVRVLGA